MRSIIECIVKKTYSFWKFQQKHCLFLALLAPLKKNCLVLIQKSLFLYNKNCIKSLLIKTQNGQLVFIIEKRWYIQRKLLQNRFKKRDGSFN